MPNYAWLQGARLDKAARGGHKGPVPCALSGSGEDAGAIGDKRVGRREERLLDKEEVEGRHDIASLAKRCHTAQGPPIIRPAMTIFPSFPGQGMPAVAMHMQPS